MRVFLRSTTLSTRVTGGSASVADGVLRLSVPALLNFGAFTGDLRISYDTNTPVNPGSVHTALVIGNNAIVFHPGYPDGAFRIDGVIGTNTRKGLRIFQTDHGLPANGLVTAQTLAALGL